MNIVLSGLKAWVWQRISAGIVLLGLIYLLFNIYNNSWDFNSWQDWVRQDLRLAFFLVFISALLIHSWIGIRDIILDYVKPFALRLAVLLLFAFSLSSLGIWVLVILLRSGSGT
jgi:succinate dehydrogenase / fumarate reductase membrane anchor subunit